SLLEAVLLRFLLAGVAGEETGALQRATQFGVDLAQAAGDAEAHGAGLARDPAAVDRGVDVIGLGGVRHPERLGDEHAVGGGREVALDRELVHPDGALAPAGADARP